MFLIETLSFASKIEDIRIRASFDHCFSVDKVGRSGGLAIFWNNTFHCEIINYSRNHIDVVVLESNVRAWRLFCFYGFPERDKQKESWDFLRTLAGQSSLPWCILGDFNNLLYTSDK